MGFAKEQMMRDEERGVEFVRALVEGGYLDGAALGVARQWLDKDEDSLSERQAWVLEHHVLAPFVTDSCARCGQAIPWSEMLAARDNGGYCGWCQHQWERMLDE